MSAALLALAAAQGLTVCADRPGKASQTCTVPAGHVQVEAGLVDWSVTTADGKRNTALTLGQFGVKYGLTDRSHVEIDVTPWERVGGRSGFGDLALAYRQRLTAADAALQIAASPFVKIPTARRPIGNRQLEGGILLPIQYAIPRSALTVAITPELDWAADGDGHGHHALASNVVSLGWQASSKLSLSAELWGQWDWDPARTGRQVSADVAAAYLTSGRVQLDAGANFGLNRATPDAELYAGVSMLF